MPSLCRVLAINILGRFLINRDNNIRYVALNTLHKVVGQDAQAVQRHRNTIVDCLKDNDSSIRQRALELVYALVNEANVKVLVKELLSYLMACDVEFKDELTQRICTVVEKYATDKEWHVDTIIQTLLVSTSFTSEETVCSMIALITSNPDLQAYATHKLYATLAANTTQPVLLQLAVWCVGEYGELLVGSPSPIEGAELPEPKAVVDLLAGVLRSPVADMVTKEYTINALMKLTSRFTAGSPAHALIHKQLAHYSTSMNLELQQRSVEYASLLKLDSISAGKRALPVFSHPASGVHLWLCTPSCGPGERPVLWPHLRRPQCYPSIRCSTPTPALTHPRIRRSRADACLHEEGAQCGGEPRLDWRWRDRHDVVDAHSRGARRGTIRGRSSSACGSRLAR